MKKYQVEITETRTTIITVRANSEEEAEKSARDGYDNGEFDVNILENVSFEVL